MPIEENIRKRIDQLIDQGLPLTASNQHGQVVSEDHRRNAVAWLTSAQNIVHLICPNTQNPYRQSADRIATAHHGYVVNRGVGEVIAILRNLLVDADAGLLASISD